MRGRMFAGVALAALAILCICTAPTLAATQMFPVKKDSKGVSAYLIKPTEGMAELPAGWQKITSLSYGNSSLAEECLTPAAKDAVCTTTSYSLPKSEYTVSVLMRGEGKARLKGAADWTAMKSAADNTYTWIEIGAVNEATEVVVEIASSGARTFFYAGLLAEGQVMPVIPVAGVLQRIKAGEIGRAHV